MDYMKEQYLYPFTLGFKFGLATRLGSIVFPPKVKEPVIRDGLFIFYDKGKNGFVYYDLYDDSITPQTTDSPWAPVGRKILSQESISTDKDELIVTKKVGRYGYVDKDGKEVIPFIYQWADAFEGNYACVQKRGLYGYIDRNGNEVMPIKFQEIKRLTENLYFANKTTVVDIHGNTLFEAPKHDLNCIRYNAHVYECIEWKQVTPFERCLTSALYNEQGQEILPCEYSFYECYEHNRFIRVSHHGDDKEGLIDIDGKIIMPIEYDKIITSLIGDAGFIIAKSGRKWSTFALDGTLIDAPKIKKSK